MALQTFTIKEKLPSWNTIAGGGKWAYKKAKDTWQGFTYESALEAKLKPITEYPVDVSVHAKWKHNRCHDIDSCYVKPIFDQLVYMGILKDDSLEYVDRVTYSGEIGADEDCVIITLCN